MLTISNLTLSFGDLQILKGVDLSIGKGDRVGIIGPNGSGKTTLFNCISGFYFPQGGTITFKDSDMTKLPPAERARLGLARTFQNFGVFRRMTVLENILTAIETRDRITIFRRQAARAIRDEAMHHLEMVNLAPAAQKKAGALSGGQMRLLEISRGLACGADLFLLDEPTAGVSPRMKVEIERVLLTLEGADKTILVIEHDMNFVQRLCARIIVLDDGRAVLSGTPDEVRADPRLQEVYFGGDTEVATLSTQDAPIERRAARA